MAYIQVRTEAEFKAAKPQPRKFLKQERALFDWAMENKTYVSLADGSEKLYKIKIPPNMFNAAKKFAIEKAPDMKIVEGNGSTLRGQSSAKTKVTENLQCIYLAAKYETKSYDRIDLEKVTSFYGDLTIKQCLNLIEKSAGTESWYDSSRAIADAIYNKYRGTGWKFRKGDVWVKSIYKKFNQFNKEKIFSQGDKWNPADIWMTKGAPKIPDSITNILGLNVWIESEYDKGNIIPISLKQHQRKGPAELKVKNDQGYKPDDYKFDGYSISITDYNRSKYTVLYFDNSKREKIFLRTVPAFVGEVQGPNYRIGKITYSNSRSPLGRRIERYLPKSAQIDGKEVNLTVPDFDQTKTRFNAPNQQIQNEMMLEFYNTYKNILLSPPNDDNPQHTGTPDTADEFDTKVKSVAATDDTYKVSKYIGMKIILATLHATDENRNTFISSVVQYAKSESQLSCLHILNQ